MRYMCATLLTVVAALIPFEASGQAPVLSVSNYQLVSENRESRTVSDFLYRADLVNTGPSRPAFTATVTSKVPGIQVIQGNLHFVNVPASGRVTSSDTFIIRLDRTVSFDFADLQWTFSPAEAPLANPGPDQTRPVGATVKVNGSGSTNPGGAGTLSYSWALASRPAGSSAVLSNPESVAPTFVIDVAGAYLLTLTVNNGLAADSRTVTISTNNTAPMAKPGPNRSVAAGSNVKLNGSASSDVDGDPLTYSWKLAQRPDGSAAGLEDASSVSPVFLADKAGMYVLQLIVSDGKANSAPATVQITTSNTPPAADAGSNQTVDADAVVQLDGSRSTDADGDLLTYRWSLISVPAGSTAVLSSAAAVNPAFTPDVEGTYIAQLIVDDGTVSSSAATITISTSEASVPTASAGAGQTVKHGSLITLDGSGADSAGRSLTFQWSLLTKPAGSTASLSGATSARPTFTADLAGDYVAQLIVNNGVANSAPETVKITTINTAPVTDAGADQNDLLPGATVTLDGSGSSDADADALSYKWSFTSRPEGSKATLSAANSPTPAFVADMPGMYVTQLIVSDKLTTTNHPDTLTVVVAAGPAASISVTSGSPQGTPINTAFPRRLVATVRDSGGNPVSGVRVTFVTPPPGSVARASFPGGANTAVTNASGIATSNELTANGITGTYNVNARVTGVAAPAVFTLTNTVRAASISVTSGSGQSTPVSTAFADRLAATVRDAGGNPIRGITVTFVSPAPGSGPRASFAGGVNTAVTNAAGVATSRILTANNIVGSYKVNARVTGVAAPAAFALTNTPGTTLPALSLTGATIGRNLQTTVAVILPAAAPAGGRNVTITSNTPNLVKLALLPGAAGTSQVTVNVPQGQTSANVFAQAFADDGAGQITASSPGFTNAIATINLRPAGFVLAGPAGIGVSSFNLPRGTNTQLTISAAQLDTSLNYVTTQQVRGGLTANIQISNSTPAVGTVSPATVAIAGGTSARTTNFNALTPGNTLMTVAAPPGFVVPGAGLNSLVGVVFSTGLLTPTVTVGQNLEATKNISVNTAPSGAVPVTITSNDPSRLLFSTTAAAAGTPSITLNIAPGTTGTPSFFIHGLASSGSATYTAMAAGYGTATGTVNFAASGFIIELPSSDFTTTTGAANTEIQIQSYQLSSGAPAVVQAVRGGLSVNVLVSSSSQSVGTITTSPVVFNGGTSLAVTQFNPLSTGTTTISVNKPTGFTTPASGTSRVATVITPSLGLTNGLVIGRNLQASGTVLLGQPAPPGGTSVQITSNSGQLQLAKQPGVTGSSSITILIAAGQTSSVYYVHALGSSGTAVYTATAPGYLPRTATITMAPSGVTIAGPFGFGLPLTATVNGGPQPVSLFTARLGPGNAPAEIQALAGGLSLSVQLNNSNPGVGTVPTPVIINGGTGSAGNPAQANFTPSSVGSTQISVVTPAGYTQPSADTTLTAQVSP